MYLIIFAGKQLHSHDSEYKPENKAYQQYVEDGWNGLDQGINDYLWEKKFD